jgi:hypothetical protein
MRNPASYISGASCRNRLAGIRTAGAVMLRLACTPPAWSQIGIAMHQM